VLLVHAIIYFTVYYIISMTLHRAQDGPLWSPQVVYWGRIYMLRRTDSPRVEHSWYYISDNRSKPKSRKWRNVLLRTRRCVCRLLREKCTFMWLYPFSYLPEGVLLSNISEYDKYNHITLFNELIFDGTIWLEDTFINTTEWR
jgi:hypothetical protein